MTKETPIQKAFLVYESELTNPNEIKNHILGELDLLYSEIAFSETCELSPRAIQAMKKRVNFIINLIESTPIQ
jgi:hypothetical protein